jgi:hypothetical protein
MLYLSFFHSQEHVSTVNAHCAEYLGNIFSRGSISLIVSFIPSDFKFLILFPLVAFRFLHDQPHAKMVTLRSVGYINTVHRLHSYPCVLFGKPHHSLKLYFSILLHSTDLTSEFCAV